MKRETRSFNVRDLALASITMALAALLTLPGCAKKEAAETSSTHESAPQSSSTPSGSAGVQGEGAEPTMIRASHILIAYQGSMRSTATRTREEAMARAQEAYAKATAPGADFGALAVEYSDDPTAAQNRGDLNVFGKGSMVPEFETPAWKLKVGEVSGVVETPFGFHIIQRTM